MKHFWRKNAGKAILFLACLFSAIILLASIAGAAVMWEFGVYSYGRDEMFTQIMDDQAFNDMLWTIDQTPSDITGDSIRIYSQESNLLFSISDKNGQITAQSKDYSDRTEAVYTGNVIRDYNYDENGIPVRRDNVLCISMNYPGHVMQRYIGEYSEPAAQVLSEGSVVSISFREGMPVPDIYAVTYRLVSIAGSLRYSIYIIMACAFVLMLVTLIALMCVSGRRPEDEDVHPGLLNRIPFDVMTAAVGIAVLCACLVIDEFSYRDYESFAAAAVLSPFVLAMLLGYAMSFSARLKEHSIIKGLLITFICRQLFRFCRFVWDTVKRFCRFVWTLIAGIPSVWKLVLLVAADALINVFLIAVSAAGAPEAGLVFLFLKTLAVGALVIWLGLKFRILQKGAMGIATGSQSGPVDTSGMTKGMKDLGDNLNNISNGIGIAVEQRMKAERMKTELITNVSHDIKTPLTSIINYVGLIQQEECDNPKHAEYCEVLMRQSERLKKLIVDLVEASKAATGNIEVHPVPCEADVFLTQAAGEYEEKLDAAGLSLVVKHPEEKFMIPADGRYMWRIFDNLMNNICKYSLPGSRVYLTLERQGNIAQFLFKNTSKEVLDISEDELMERFVRGDSSRNTEGNGLGLSIAKSLAQLQNGWLGIETDGDLFKAILRFPIVEPAVADAAEAETPDEPKD